MTYFNLGSIPSWMWMAYVFLVCSGVVIYTFAYAAEDETEPQIAIGRYRKRSFAWTKIVIVGLIAAVLFCNVVMVLVG